MFGLLGKKLTHSLSPTIHALLGDPHYQIWETDDLSAFMNKADFEGMNVTIPYKEAIIPYLDGLDGIAKTIGAVNTVVLRDGKKIGYNTDYYGLFKLLQHHHITLKNKKVLILGNGGAAKTAVLLATNMGASIVTKLCRHPKLADERPVSDLSSVLDYEIIFNTTPIGMYPHNDDPLMFSLSGFTKLQSVVDLIYNPLKTNLLVWAELQGIQAVNGLYMLVMQAKASRELFLNDKNINHSISKSIYDTLFRLQSNLVLVGLPLSGKTLYASLLKERYQKTVIDTDSFIEQNEQKSISEIFASQGEPYFRRLESELIDTLYQKNGQIISTGGGMIMNAELMNKLKQNGIIIYLDKDYHKIMDVDIKNRPLIQSPIDVERLALIRAPYYQKYADLWIKIVGQKPEILREIEEKLNDYFNR